LGWGRDFKLFENRRQRAVLLDPRKLVSKPLPQKTEMNGIQLAEWLELKRQDRFGHWWFAKIGEAGRPSAGCRHGKQFLISNVLNLPQLVARDQALPKISTR
jgi:hypothetical protein